MTDKAFIDDEPIHGWFELSYAQYLTIPRSILQSMPTEWQRKFVSLLNELDNTFDWRPEQGRYWVRLKNGQGKFTHDPLMDYDRGRRRIPINAAQQGVTAELLPPEANETYKPKRIRARKIVQD